ncbi:DUF6318 family protein [Cellulomonas algicola]|uniref:DUF6318 family protein n=1 Tax=Cellulomonas algicola TaxID=2071633 RepID=UPI001C3FB76F|nr:DUF6318 family protein [Cellulomonas algicola]
MSNRARGHGRIRTAVAAAGVALIAAGVTSCTKEDARRDASASPSQSATSSGAPSVAAAPTPTTPGTIAALPDGVKPSRPLALDAAPTVESAQAVLTYWLQLLPYAQQAGDVTEAKAMSHPECEFCNSITGSIEELLSKGDRSVGGGYTISDQFGTEVVLGNWYSLKLTLVEAPSSEVDKFGTTLKTYPGHTYSIDAIVLHESGAWSIRGVSYEVLA